MVVQNFVRIGVLVLVLALVASSPLVAQSPLSLLNVATDAPAPPHVEVPAGAQFFRVDIYLGDAPPAGMWPEDFDSARAGGTVRPVLIADRDDAAPLGNRTPLIMVHGVSVQDATDPTAVRPQKAAIFDPFRKTFPPTLRSRYKNYFYLYPTDEGPVSPGRELAQLCRNTLAEAGRPDGKLAFVAHSMGGLVIRHAMNENNLGEQVVCAATIATPHHGSALASLFGANSRLSKKLGWFRYAALQATLMVTPYPRSVDTLAYDNSGNELVPDEARDMGVRINGDLAAFNARDRYLSKITAMMADLRSPSKPWGVFKMLRHIPGYIVSPLSEHFNSIDPLVHYESGVCEGDGCAPLPFKNRKSYQAVDHGTIMESANVMNDIYSELDRVPAESVAAAR